MFTELKFSNSLILESFDSFCDFCDFCVSYRKFFVFFDVYSKIIRTFANDMTHTGQVNDPVHMSITGKSAAVLKV